MKLLFLGRLGTGEMIIAGLFLFLIPIIVLLLICGAFRSIPPDPQTLDRSKWKPITMKIRNGVILYLIADIIGSIIDFFDKIQDVGSILSVASSPEDLFSAWTNSIDIISGASIANIFVIVGYFMYYTGLGQFSIIHQDNTTNYKITKIRTAALLGIIAVVLDYIPFIGGVASWIVNIIMYSTLASSFSYLKVSPVFNTRAKAGASLLQTASTMYIIGMFIPVIGRLFELLGFFMTLIGWGRIAKGGPISSTQTIPQGQLVTPESDRVETILDQHRVYCSKCGAKCKDYQKYCPHCGFGLHPEREESSHGYSSYASPVNIPEQPEYSSPAREKPITADNPILAVDNLQRPSVTKDGGVIHTENTVHPTVESQPEPSLVIAKEQKKPSLPSPVMNKKWGKWVLVAFAVVLLGGLPAYLFWYKPYAIDRDAPRYFTFSNLNLRSSRIADVKHNFLKLLPYGSELITYSIDADWASVKVNGQKGFVASNLIISSDDFELLNSVWGNTDAQECIGTAKCRLAVLDYYKRFQMEGATEWQIYTRKKEDQANTVFYKKLYNSNNKFTDFTFIVMNNRTNERELVIYSFDDNTEKPIFRTARRLSSSESGYIKSMTSSGGWISIQLTDGERINL